MMLNSETKKYEIENLQLWIKVAMDNITKKGIEDSGLKAEDYLKKQNRKKLLSQALQNSGQGNLEKKLYIKAYIRDLLLKEYKINSKNIDHVVNFENDKKLSSEIKFLILLYKYKKEYGFNAFKEIIEKYKLAVLNENDNDEDVNYSIDKDDIEKIYETEEISLSLNDKVDIVTQIIYQNVYGNGVVDELFDMSIDGISGGVSGITENLTIKYNNETELERLHSMPKNYESVWIFYSGKSIQLKFLSFKRNEELERICTNIYTFDNPGSLTQQNGYIVNTMPDGSRVVVFRPPFSESWCFFIRKFDNTSDKKLKDLYEDTDLIVNFFKYIMKGGQTVIITGEQGTGKTTLLTALINEIYPIYTLRIFESFFETHLRKKYPNRNILTLQELENIEGQQALDIIKKTDGVVTIIGEIAEYPIASYTIQAGQTASKFTIATHHAQTFDDLIAWFRNALLSTGSFTNEKIAEQQVISVIKFDIHLSKDIYGNRYIDRVTECIPTKDESYIDINDNMTIDDITKTDVQNRSIYYKNITRKTYEKSDIIIYDEKEKAYKIKNCISEEKIKDMLKNMTEKDRKEFQKFLARMFKREKVD